MAAHSDLRDVEDVRHLRGRCVLAEQLEDLPFAIGEGRLGPRGDTDTLDVAAPQLLEKVLGMAAREGDFALHHALDGAGESRETQVFREISSRAREHRGKQLLPPPDWS